MGFSNNVLPHLKHKYEDGLILALRLALGTIFVWFGILKVLGYNPVFDLVASVTPFLASGVGLSILGWFEVALGVSLLINRWRTVTHTLLVLHLSGTFLTFVMGPEIVFQPAFPILSLAGEFVVKNMILMLAGIIVLLHESHRKHRTQTVLS